jgi:hypothetical protein
LQEEENWDIKYKLKIYVYEKNCSAYQDIKIGIIQVPVSTA